MGKEKNRLLDRDDGKRRKNSERERIKDGGGRGKKKKIVVPRKKESLSVRPPQKGKEEGSRPRYQHRGNENRKRFVRVLLGEKKGRGAQPCLDQRGEKRKEKKSLGPPGGKGKRRGKIVRADYPNKEEGGGEG